MSKYTLTKGIHEWAIKNQRTELIPIPIPFHIFHLIRFRFESKPVMKKNAK